MARTSHPTYSRRRASTVRATTSNTATATPARESPMNVSPAGNTVPAYTMNQPVLIQYRTDIWIPGVVTRQFYNARFACLVTEVEFYTADGSRTRTGFLARDIRPNA